MNRPIIKCVNVLRVNALIEKQMQRVRFNATESLI